jgi:hypothetical protein
MENTASQTSRPREPWNKGKLVGQKAPFRDLGLDSKLRSCDLAKLRVRDICHGDRVPARNARREPAVHLRVVSATAQHRVRFSPQVQHRFAETQGRADGRGQ